MVVNGENAADSGRGITKKISDELAKFSESEILEKDIRTEIKTLVDELEAVKNRMKELYKKIEKLI